MTNDLLTCLFDNDVMDLLLLMAQRTNQVCGPRVLADTYAFRLDNGTDSLTWARSCKQGRLRADTPLLLEVFSTIFKDLDAQELLHAQPSSGQTAVAGRQ